MPEEILDPKFDLSSFLRELRIGYTELSQKKVDLETLIVSSNTELEATKAQLETISKILSVAGIAPEADLSRPRQSNLSAIATGVVLEVFSNPSVINVPESELIRLVLAESPTAKEKSVQSALYKLSEKTDAFGGTKCLRRSGKRGSYVYSLQIDLGSDFTEAPLDSTAFGIPGFRVPIYTIGIGSAEGEPLKAEVGPASTAESLLSSLENRNPQKVSSVSEFLEKAKAAKEAREAEAEKFREAEKATFEDRVIEGLLIQDPVGATAALASAIQESVQEALISET